MANTTTTIPDPNEDRSGTILAISIPMATVVLFLVACRFISRRIGRTSLWWDDWLILFATVVNLGGLAIDVLDVHLGAGKHIGVVIPANISPFLITVYVTQAIYPPIIASVKCSILCLYLRLFGIHRTFSKLVHGTMAVIAAWFVAAFIPVLFQCTPVAANWTMDLPYACINMKIFLLAINIPNTIFDFWILALPMPIVWRLNLPRGKRLAICGIFMLGALDTIISIIRLPVIGSLDFTDFTYNSTDVFIWSSTEPTVGIICACLPVTVPLVQKVFGNFLGRTVTGNSNGSSFDQYGNRTEPSFSLPIAATRSHRRHEEEKPVNYSRKPNINRPPVVTVEDQGRPVELYHMV